MVMVIYRQIIILRLFRNDPTFKTYFTVVIIICAIRSCQNIYLYKTKRVFTNLSKYYLRLTARSLMSAEVLFSLFDASIFRVII